MSFKKITLTFTLLPLLLIHSAVLAHPVPESSELLVYPGDEGPGKGKHIVLITAFALSSLIRSMRRRFTLEKIS